MDEKDVLFRYESDLSRYVVDGAIKLSIEDEIFLRKFSEFLIPKVFISPRREVVECVRNFWNRKQKVLGEGIWEEIKRFVSERKKELVYGYLEGVFGLSVDKEYVEEKFGEYVKQKLLEEGIVRAREAVRRGEFNYAEGILLGIFKDISRLGEKKIEDFFEEEEMSKQEEENEINFRTGMRCYDEVYGGLWRKEMLLVLGDTNVGKTYCCVYLGKMALLQRKKVLHVTLETAKEVVEERYKMSFVAQLSKRMKHIWGGELENEIEVNVGDEVVKAGILSDEKVKRVINFLKRKGGKLWISQGLKFKVSDLVKLLDQIEVHLGEKADVVIVDSPDQMVGGGSGEELRMKERDIYRRLLDITKERNITMIVTTQARRGTKKKFLVKSDDVAEAYDKVRIVDTVWTINQTEEEKKKGVVRIYVDKVRIFGKSGMLIEGDQNLAIGQFLLNARKIDFEDLKEKKDEKK